MIDKRVKRETVEKTHELTKTLDKGIDTIVKEAKRLGFDATVVSSVKLRSKELSDTSMMMIGGNGSTPEISILEGGVRGALATVGNNSVIENLALVAELDIRGILDDFIELNYKLAALYDSLSELKNDEDLRKVMMEHLGEFPDSVKKVVEDAIKRNSKGAKK